MNNISVLRRFGVVAAIVAGAYTGSVSAAEIFTEDFANPVAYGDCNRFDLNALAPTAFWREETLRLNRAYTTQSIGFAAGNITLTGNDPGGGGLVSKLDSRFDFLSPGNKRKIVVKGVKISGANDDETGKMFRLLVSSHECKGNIYPSFEITIYADGRFNVGVAYVKPNGAVANRFLIDANYALPRAAEQIELTLDNTNYELSFVFNVAEDPALPRSEYQGAFTYRGAHGMTPAIWGATQFPAEKYGASIGLFASAPSSSNPATVVTLDSITVTDGAP